METMQEFIDFVEVREFNCWSCGTFPTEIRYYPHSVGLLVNTFKTERVWAYIHCEKCGYDTSFQKIPGELPFRPKPIFVTVNKPKLIFVTVNKQRDDNVNKKPWRGWCCRPCWYARKKECICRCRKAGHRKGVEQPLTSQDSTGLTEDQAIKELEK